MIKNNKINKLDLIRLCVRSCLIEFTWNYEQMMNLGCSYSLALIFKKLYKNDVIKLSQSLKDIKNFSILPLIFLLFF